MVLGALELKTISLCSSKLGNVPPTGLYRKEFCVAKQFMKIMRKKKMVSQYLSHLFVIQLSLKSRLSEVTCGFMLNC